MVSLELELIQTHMTQKPMLRVEAGARALRMLVKNMCGWTERASAGVQGTCVWAWISGVPVRAGCKLHECGFHYIKFSAQTAEMRQRTGIS